MAATFKGKITLRLEGDYDNNLGEISTDVVKLDILRTYNITNGTGANQANLLFRDQRTLTTGANEDLDLAGVLTDPFGTTITFDEVRYIYFYSASANTTNLTITGKATNGFITPFQAAGHGIVVSPDGCALLIAPDATGFNVTAATGDLLTITNASGASATYDIVIIGS